MSTLTNQETLDIMNLIARVESKNQRRTTTMQDNITSAQRLAPLGKKPSALEQYLGLAASVVIFGGLLLAIWSRV